MEDGGLWLRLGSPRLVVAPMVEASELAWRMLSRRHKAQLCYTPMFHSQVFTKDPKYRKENFTTCPEDRPLIVQFCGNKPEVILEAAKIVEHMCDAVDINLGCPQAIAKRGHYGAFLQDEWELVGSIVKALSDNLSIPVTCKIRVFDNVQKTIDYARMLEKSGCKLLTVHGRTREQRGPLTGLADWDHIKAVREALSIPVFANGNIQNLADVHRCLEEVGCAGVMTAEGNLHNPALFEGASPPTWEIALEYLDLTELYPCPPSFIRGHLFKLFHSLLCLEENVNEREEFAKGADVNDFRRTVVKLKEKYESHHNGAKVWTQPNPNSDDYNLELPPWLCQPRVRISPEEHLKKLAAGEAKGKENQQLNEAPKRTLEDGTEIILSKKKMKKLQKKPNHTFIKREFQKCSLCLNPMGMKCVHNLCKTCCRSKCQKEVRDCPGHRILVKTKNENFHKSIDVS